MKKTITILLSSVALLLSASVFAAGARGGSHGGGHSDHSSAGMSSAGGARANESDSLNTVSASHYSNKKTNATNKSEKVGNLCVSCNS